MFRGSPKIVALSKAAQKKASPKAAKSKKCGGGVERAAWNVELEKSLVDLLFEHNMPPHRAQNGWSPDAWNKIVSKFHKKHEYVTFNKIQIQEKERELKREYKILKEARKQSGVSWNEKRCMIIAEPTIWDNIITTFPRAKKFRNKSFPIFDALGELYDGHIAQGTWNITSTQPLQNSDDGEKFKTIEVEYEDTNEPQVDARIEQDEDIVIVERVEHRLPKRSGAPTVNQEKETKRVRKDALEGLIGRYLDVKTKQVADEATQSTKEKEVAQDNDFSIKRCISVLKTMDITRDEKIKAAEVFNTPNYRETFICFNDDEPEVALLWPRGKMDKL